MNHPYPFVGILCALWMLLFSVPTQAATGLVIEQSGTRTGSGL